MSKQSAGLSSGIVALVFLAAFYGITAVLARYLSAGNGLFEQWYLRYGIAFLVGLVVFRTQIDLRKFLHLPSREWLVLFVRAIAMAVVAVSLYTVAAQRAKIGPVAFMQAIPSTMLLAVLLMHDKLPLKKFWLVLVSFVGVVIVAVKNPHDLLTFNVGELYSLVSGFVFSFAFVTRRWHTGVLSNKEITLAIIGIGGALDYILSLVLYHRVFPITSQWSPLFIAILVVAGAASVGSIFLQNYGFEHVSGVVAGSILNLEQVFGPLFGFIFYREGLALRELIGGIIIVAAALAMNRLDRAEPTPMPAPD